MKIVPRAGSFEQVRFPGLRRLGILLPIVLGLMGGCASQRAPETQARAKAREAAAPVEGPLFAQSSAREVRALLLYLVDQQRYEPVALAALLDSSPATRERLAVAVGQIGDRRGRTILQGLLVDAEAPVRREAAFALGELEASDATRSLLAAAVDDDTETGMLAVEALGKLGTPLADVRRVLTALEEDEAERRLAPFLFRFPGEGMVAAASALLASAAPSVRIDAAYALGRVPTPDGLPLLRTLVADPHEHVRAMSARGLGEVGDQTDLARLEPLLGDHADSPRIQALRAGARILGRVQALPPLSWGDPIVRLVSDPSPGVRATAIEAAVPWIGREEVRAAVLRAADAGEPREQELALLALVEGGDSDAAVRVERWAGDADRMRRVRAAEGAGVLGRDDLLRLLAEDPEPMVRVAAISALVAAASAAAKESVESRAAFAALARRALTDPDPPVRATVLDALAENPQLADGELRQAFEAAVADPMGDARLAAVRALVARGIAVDRERATVLEALHKLAADRDPIVRREAAHGVSELGGVPPAEPIPFGTAMRRQDYALVVEQTERPRLVHLVTERGTLGVRLDCPRAPLTCLSFLKLAAQGYFDGLTFHRVVPDFVVQGGDPRGDGWGGPGYAIRDEIGRSRYERGTLGMALSGPDTGGSQFFLTLNRQPHLDGGYTIFGQVVSGDEILDRIRQGDRILEVREVLGNE